MKPEIGAGAIFSKDKKHRYALWRIWDTDKPMLMFIGLNPSTANENKNDATIKRVLKIARHNGYGGFYMMNLFSIVSTDPDYCDGKNTPENDGWLHVISLMTECTVVCWGNFKVARERGKEVLQMISNPLCLHQNKNGSPKHPLYCKYSSILKPYKI